VVCPLLRCGGSPRSWPCLVAGLASRYGGWRGVVVCPLLRRVAGWWRRFVVCPLLRRVAGWWRRFVVCPLLRWVAGWWRRFVVCLLLRWVAGFAVGLVWWLASLVVSALCLCFSLLFLVFSVNLAPGLGGWLPAPPRRFRVCPLGVLRGSSFFPRCCLSLPGRCWRRFLWCLWPLPCRALAVGCWFRPPLWCRLLVGSSLPALFLRLRAGGGFSLGCCRRSFCRGWCCVRWAAVGAAPGVPVWFLSLCRWFPRRRRGFCAGF